MSLPGLTNYIFINIAMFGSYNNARWPSLLRKLAAAAPLRRPDVFPDFAFTGIARQLFQFVIASSSNASIAMSDDGREREVRDAPMEAAPSSGGEDCALDAITRASGKLDWPRPHGPLQQARRPPTYPSELWTAWNGPMWSSAAPAEG